jgi:succinoglycan biosynthesis transport protein ExoP
MTAVQNEFNVAQSREASIEQSFIERPEKLVQRHHTSRRSSCVSLNVKLRRTRRCSNLSCAKFQGNLAGRKAGDDQFPKVIERAATPTRPSAPNKKMIALAGLIGGLGLGVVIAFLLEQLDSGFRTNRQIEQRLGVPVLASVPRADGELAPSGIGGVLHKINPFGWLFRLFRRGGEPDRRMGRSARVNMSRLVTEKPLSTFTEAIRSLRMGIKFADIDRPQKVILMTSALPGEGKSTVASNLAQHAANAPVNACSADRPGLAAPGVDVALCAGSRRSAPLNC